MKKLNWTHIVTMALSILSTVYAAVVDPTNKLHLAVFGGGGIIAGLVTTVAKLIHDKGVSVATITQAGSDVAQALPQIRSDLQTILPYAQQLPALSTIVDQIQSRVSEAEKQIAAVPAIPQIVEAVKNSLAAGAIATPAAAPSAPPAN